MQNKRNPRSVTKKPLQWAISSTSISFMRTHELEAARDGSTNDCSLVSPLPQPKRKPARRAAKS